MWENYARALYRTLSRRWLYALINGLGLALGLAVFATLALVVRFETGFDRWIPDAADIYRIDMLDSWPGQPRAEQPSTQGVLLPNLVADFPQIAAGARLIDSRSIVQHGAEATYEHIVLADPAIFKVFDLPFAAGDRSSALRDPASVVLTQSSARKYLGTEAALGRTLTLSIQGVAHPFRVTGVMRDLPPNTHLRLDILAPLSPYAAPQSAKLMDNWGSSFLYTYVRLRSASDAAVLQAAFPAFIDRRTAGDAAPHPASRFFGYKLRPLLGLNFTDAGSSEAFKPGISPLFVAALGTIGVVALVIAIVNYVSLATAYASVRAREVAIRKVTGATRRALIVQFVAEAVAVALAAALLAAAMLEFAAPAVSGLLGEPIRFRYWGVEGVALPLIAMALAVGAAAGLYPALVLSRFEPAAVLASARTPSGGRRGARLRELLAFGQFTAAIALMVCTAVIFGQMQFLRHAPVGFRRDGLVIVQMGEPAVRKDKRALLETFRNLPGVIAATASTRRPAADQTLSTSVYRLSDPAQKVALVQEWIAPDYVRAYGARMAAGRPLGADRGMDDSAHLDTDSPVRRQANIMINRSAASALGFGAPSQALGQTLSFDSRSGNPFHLTIVGVIDDVRFRSPHEKPKAQFYLEDSLLGHDEGGRLEWHAAIRVARGEEAATLRRIGAVWRTMEPGAPLRADTAPGLLEPYYDPEARRGQLFAAGSALAGLIACLGLYGLAAFSTSRRFKEIGVRKTLGASTPDILRLLVGEFLRPVVFANLLAWPVAWLAMRTWLGGFDQRISLSPWHFLAPALLAIMIAIATVGGQSLRVARAEPANALRYE